MKRHLKRIAAPASWDIKRKALKYAIRPYPGGGKLENSLPIGIVIRDILGFAKTAREASYILNNKTVLINGKQCKEIKQAVGLMDVITFRELNKSFRVLLDKSGRLILVEIKDKTHALICKIMNKKSVRGGKTQLNLINGRNILVDKDEYKTGDAVVIENNKIVEHIPLKKGVLVFFIGGKHVGEIGRVDEIIEDNMLFKKDGAVFETKKSFAFPIGVDEPLINTG
ncbi:MAG: 30S ribosomal protein S4e [Candidatus Woesearchaeota archaeon]